METAAHEFPAQLNVMTSPMGFAELYGYHYAIVNRAALRIAGNPADAEDVLQTVLVLGVAASFGLTGLIREKNCFSA
jgi:hypothetical protein